MSVPKRGCSSNAAPGPHARNIHGAVQMPGACAYTRTAAKRRELPMPWRENLLGLTQTMHLAMHDLMHLLGRRGSQP